MISPSVLDDIAAVCVARGIKYLKTVNIELQMDLERARLSKIENKPTKLAITENVDHTPPTVGSSDPLANAQATEQIKNLIDTLKMKDEDLVNHIFPAGAE